LRKKVAACLARFAGVAANDIKCLPSYVSPRLFSPLCGRCGGIDYYLIFKAKILENDMFYYF